MLSMVLLVLGILMALRQGRVVARALRCAYWSATDGEVIATTRVTSPFVAVVGSSLLASVPCVKYRYDVAGVTYESERVSNRGDGNDAQHHGSRSYRWNQRVRVYYDPRAPEHAVLERGVPRGTVLQLCAAIMLLLAGALTSARTA
jgi:hypothetical protein